MFTEFVTLTRSLWKSKVCNLPMGPIALRMAWEREPLPVPASHTTDPGPISSWVKTCRMGKQLWRGKGYRLACRSCILKGTGLSPLLKAGIFQSSLSDLRLPIWCSQGCWWSKARVNYRWIKYVWLILGIFLPCESVMNSGESWAKVVPLYTLAWAMMSCCHQTPSNKAYQCYK